MKENKKIPAVAPVNTQKALNDLKQIAKDFQESFMELERKYGKWEQTLQRVDTFFNQIKNVQKSVEYLSTFYCQDQPHLDKSYDIICRDMKMVYDKCISILTQQLLQKTDIDIVKISKQFLKHLTGVSLQKDNQRSATQAIRNTIEAIDSIESYDSLIRKIYEYQNQFFESRDQLVNYIAKKSCNHAETFNRLCDESFSNCEPVHHFLELCNELQGTDNNEQINNILQRMNQEAGDIRKMTKVISMNIDGGKMKKRKRNTYRTQKNRRTRMGRTKRNRKQKK
jgi:hypothetical protein